MRRIHWKPSTGGFPAHKLPVMRKGFLCHVTMCAIIMIMAQLVELYQNNTKFMAKFSVGKVNGLVLNCSISIANALEILQFCTQSCVYPYYSNIIKALSNHTIQLSVRVIVDHDAWINQYTTIDHIWCNNMNENPRESSQGLTHWGPDKMDAIFQMTFSNRYSWMKMYEFRLKFHWSLFLRFQLTIFQHWFR